MLRIHKHIDDKSASLFSFVFFQHSRAESTRSSAKSVHSTKKPHAPAQTSDWHHITNDLKGVPRHRQASGIAQAPEKAPKLLGARPRRASRAFSSFDMRKRTVTPWQRPTKTSRF